MKWKHLILFLAVVVAACSTRHPVETRLIASQNQQLQAIDSLMWRQPDSALMLLVDFAASPQADSPSTFDGHYFQILLSELLYKNDCEQTNRAELLKAVDYFDSLYCRDAACHVSTDNIVFLDARAHYINGAGFYEQGNVVNACEEYLEALEVMEERFEEKELVGLKARFMALAFNRLGDLFCNQYMMENAISCFEAALPYCKMSPTSNIGVSRILYNIGHQYEMLSDSEQAIKYYREALEHLPDSNKATYRDICSHVVLCNYDLGLKIDQAVKALRLFDAQSSKDCEHLIYALFIGSIYAEEKMYDSALVYLEPLFEHYGEIEAAKYLRVIYDSLGYAEKADECVRFLADNIQSEGENKALVSQLDNLFQDYLKQKQKKLAEAEHAKHIKKTVGIIVTVAVFVALGIVVVAKRRSKKLLRQKLEEQRQAHQAQQNALFGRLKQSNQEICELKERIKQQDDLSAKAEAAPTFAEEPICRLIVERVNEGQFKAKVDYAVYKDSALDKQQLLDLRVAADRHFNQFTARLKQAYPKLTNSDLDYCCLYLFGLTDADIAALMQRTYNTVFERNGKMLKIFDSENPLPATLMGFAKESSFD